MVFSCLTSIPHFWIQDPRFHGKPSHPHFQRKLLVELTLPPAPGEVMRPSSSETLASIVELWSGTPSNRHVCSMGAAKRQNLNKWGQ